MVKTRRFSNHVSRLLLRSHTFAIIVKLDLKIHQSMWIHWPFFPKTWTKGHWPLDDLWPHVCWGHMCDSTQGSLCPSPMTIHQCMWIQWSILQIPHTYTYILHTTYRMSDHRVSYWTQFRRDNKIPSYPSYPIVPIMNSEPSLTTVLCDHFTELFPYAFNLSENFLILTSNTQNHVSLFDNSKMSLAIEYSSDSRCCYSGIFLFLSVLAYWSRYSLIWRGCAQIVNKRKVLAWHHAKLHLQ